MSLYGILISLAIWIVIIKTEKLANSINYEAKVIWDLSLVAIIFGLIGARLYHVLSALPYYLTSPLKVFALGNGGLGIYGAIVFGFLGIYAYSIHKKLNYKIILDLISINLPLGQAVGRLGNFINQELYGKPTNLPWKIYISPDNRLDGYQNVEYYHPLFAYEALANLILFLFLTYLFKKNKEKVGSGIFLKIYLVGYAVIRFCLEFLRIDNWHIYGINTAQLISILIICSVIFSHVIYSKRSWRLKP